MLHHDDIVTAAAVVGGSSGVSASHYPLDGGAYDEDEAYHHQ